MPEAWWAAGTTQAQSVNFLAKVGTSGNGPAATTTATNNVQLPPSFRPSQRLSTATDGTDKALSIAAVPVSRTVGE
jgi:hypothetical protein